MVSTPPEGLESMRSDACASLSAATDEPMLGRAGRTRAWLMVEHNGPWHADAENRALGPDVVEEIMRRAPDLRIVLIRRPDRPSLTKARCIVGWIGGSDPWMREGELDAYSDVLAIELEELAAGRPVDFGRPRSAPLYAVCTHGKKDACCAEFGRPVLHALNDAIGEDVFEVTHIGGDRFAANMVIFPHGLYYGRLTPETALLSVEAYQQGEIRLPNLRGRPNVSAPSQAAEHIVRAKEGLKAIDDVAATNQVDLGDGSWDVDVCTSAGDFRVRTRQVTLDRPMVYRCGESDRAPQKVWAMMTIERLPDFCGADHR